MRKFKIFTLVLVIFMSMGMPINATDKQSKETTKEYHLQVPLQAKGNYYTTITDGNCIMTLEVLDPTDKSVPINIDKINTRSLGNEEFAPGNYTRTLRYSETLYNPNPNTEDVTFKAEWQVKFTIYVDSTYPKITYVSNFTKLETFAISRAPYLRRAQASSSLPAYAEASAFSGFHLYDAYNRNLYMTYYLY